MNALRELPSDGHTPPADAAVWCSLRHIHLAVSRGLDAELQATHRLPLGEYELLRALATPGCAQRMAGLAAVVGLSPSGLTRAIERLERRRLVRRLPCPVDRRGAQAELSDAGLDLLRRATVTHDAALHALLLDGLTPAEGALLLQLSERVAGPGTGSVPRGTGPPSAHQGARFTTEGMPASTAAGESEQQEAFMIDRNAFNAQVVEAFRTHNGAAPDQVGDMPLLLLTTTGAKSGQPRLSPLAYVMDGDRYVVVASKGGAPTHPDWYHNIVANPQVTVEVGPETFAARAEIAPEPERTRLFNAAATEFPRLREHEQNTERTIPVITLTRN